MHVRGDIKGAEAGYRAIIASTGGVPEAYSNLAIICKGTGRLDEAMTLWKQAVALKPDYPDAHFNLGNALKDQGRLESAATSYRKALAIKPAFVGAHNNLGLTLHEQGKLEGAVASYRNALMLKPDFAVAHNNLGLALQDQGKFEEAVASHHNALNITPDSAGAHYNLGNALTSWDKLEQAIISYRKAVALKPDFADAHNNLGLALKGQGKIGEAVASYQKALSIKPNDANVLANFARALLEYEIFSVSDEIVNLIIRCFESPQIESSEVNTASQSILTGDLRNYIEERASIDVAVLGRPTVDLLVANLRNSLITKSQLECFLVRVRRNFLQGAKERNFEAPKQEPQLRVCKALAHQSFFNEFVWEVTDEENQIVRQLEERIFETINSKEIPADNNLFLLASYRPLHQNEVIRNWHMNALPKLERDSKASLSHLILNPVKEAALAINIEQLTPVNDDVSLAVQSQYEANPYPRWNSLTIRPPRPYTKQIRREIAPHRPKLIPTTDTPNILIAGCGTGRQPISTALRFSNSKVLAIDLSRSSLAYAKRKAKEMEVTNIRFGLADILKLGELDERFDVIGSTGVLHHMAEPKVGLRVLVDLLKPGGFIKLGLYSDVARQHVVQLRKIIAEQGLRPNLKGIRAIRRFIRAHETDFERIQNSSDFYSTSGVRDLLFHVQEHRFTVLQLSDLVDDCKLEFLGFLISDSLITTQYVKQFPDDPDCLNLENWHTFEQENPLVFVDMYQFWCRKAG